MEKSKKEGGDITPQCIIIFFCILLFIVGVILGIVGFGIAVHLNQKNQATTFCFSLSPNEIYDIGGGDPNARGFGKISFSLSKSTVEYEILLSGFSEIYFMQIRGPTLVNNPLFAPVYLPDNGATFRTIIDEVSANGATVHGIHTASYVKIQSILETPWKYYLILGNNKKPSGAMATRLLSKC